MNEKNIKTSSFEPMRCKEVGSYLPLFILGGCGMTMEECRAVKYHLQICQRCAKACEEISFVTDILHNQKDFLIEEGLFSKLEFEDVNKEPTIEESLEELQNKLQRTGARAKHNRINRQFKVALRRSTAVAACLLIGVLTWMVFTNNRKQQNLLENTVSPQVAITSEPPVKVELVKSSGNIAIDTNQTIVADNELKTLLINGKHQMIMNTGTILKIKPMLKQSKIGCIVKLASGQIYTHVQHDGNPFIVDTTNGQAVITGTIFDINATKDSTLLVVSEGAVRFESQNGTVNVTAGQKSQIINQSVPSIPLSCNTDDLTAWATDYKLNSALAQIETDSRDWYLALSFRKEPILLAEADYNYWVNQKRTWFETNFPWIFELKDALAKEGIEVDYPELLIKGGDIWQFTCLHKYPGRFSMPDFESLLKITSFYDLDKKWLLKNVPIAKLIQDKSLLLENPTRLEAFDQLLKYIKGTEVIPYYLYPVDACKYLIETRSLVWFAVSAGEFSLTDEQRAKVLDLLQHEVIVATNCSNYLLYPEDKNKKSLCNDVCETLKNKIVGYIKDIKSIEENIKKWNSKFF